MIIIKFQRPLFYWSLGFSGDGGAGGIGGRGGRGYGLGIIIGIQGATLL